MKRLRPPWPTRTRRDAADQVPLLRRARGDRIQLWRPGASRAPREPFRALRSGLGRISVHASQPQRRARGALAPRSRLRALFQCAARYHLGSDPGDLPGGRGATEARCGRAGRTVSRFRTATGGLIERTRPLRFTFDGQPLHGCAGDTLASALLANGVHLTGRSFKYHRPRGILTAGSEEPNALVTLSRDAARVTPNLRATQIEVYEGLVAMSQNRWQSLKVDFGRLNDRLSSFFPAGFYYKTFMWPKSAWKSLYEPVIRRAAGLGRAPTHADPDRYAQRYAHCDVLVVGGGPAGIAAALAAADGGARVMLCDETAQFGGSLLA